jgi:hypothetical protein
MAGEGHATNFNSASDEELTAMPGAPQSLRSLRRGSLDQPLLREHQHIGHPRTWGRGQGN